MSEQPIDLVDQALLRPDKTAETRNPPAGSHDPLGHGDDDAAPLDLLEYVRILHKRRWMAITVFLVIFLTITLYTFTVSPVYQARVQLLIEPESHNVVSFQEVVEQNKASSDYYQTQYRILQSRTLARRTLDKLKLWTDARITGEGSESLGRRAANAVRDTIHRLFQGSRAREPRAATETERQGRVIDRFLGSLSVTPLRSSRLIEVTVDSRDAALAADLANALAQEYIEQNLEHRFLASKEASDWLTEQLAEQRQKVEASEVAVQRYREDNAAVSLEDRQNIVVQKLADLNAAVTRAKTQRLQKEALYHQVVKAQGDRAAIEALPAVLSNSYIQQLKTELSELQRQTVQLSQMLGERHPDMIKIRPAIQAAEAKIEREIGNVLDAVRSGYEAALAEERSLMQALDAQKSEALNLNRTAIDHGALQREALANRQVFDSLIQRTKETGISGALRTSNIRIVDPAEVPRIAARPKKLFNELAAALFGLVAAVGLVFFSEYLDNRLKTPRDIEVRLGLPCLGIVPLLTARSGEALPLMNHDSAGFNEAFRSLRTNLLFAPASHGARSVVVTSATPSEGKTVVAGNIAIVLAQSSLRVLLIDGDMRRPSMNAMFGIPLEPGLSNVLVGSAKASTAIRKMQKNLWVLPAGAIPPNPAELLGSKRFVQFLGALKEHFDWIVIDSPPVMAVTDSCVIAHSVSRALFVVGAEMTALETARASIDRLRAANANCVGAVLNKVDFQRNGYYYSTYYRPEYTKYYGSNQEGSNLSRCAS